MKSSTNEITGANLVSKSSNQEAYAEGYDRIFGNKDKNKDIEKSYNKPIILSNKIQCKHCGDTIESFHQHDFKFCSCGAVAVDGGTSYLRRLGSDFIDLSEIISEEKEDGWFEKVRETFTWGSYGKGGKGPKRNILLKDLEEDHIKAILETQWHIKGSHVEQYMKKELEYRNKQ